MFGSVDTEFWNGDSVADWQADTDDVCDDTGCGCRDWERRVDEHREGFQETCRTCGAHLEGVERRDGWCPTCLPF